MSTKISLKIIAFICLHYSAESRLVVEVSGRGDARLWLSEIEGFCDTSERERVCVSECSRGDD